MGPSIDQTLGRKQDGVILLQRERYRRRFRSQATHCVSAVLSAAAAIREIVRAAPLEHPRALDASLVRVVIPVAGALPGETLGRKSYKLLGLAEKARWFIRIEF